MWLIIYGIVVELVDRPTLPPALFLECLFLFFFLCVVYGWVVIDPKIARGEEVALEGALESASRFHMGSL